MALTPQLVRVCVGGCGGSAMSSDNYCQNCRRRQVFMASFFRDFPDCAEDDVSIREQAALYDDVAGWPPVEQDIHAWKHQSELIAKNSAFA